MERKAIITLALTLLVGWALPTKLLAQHEWDNFATGYCTIANFADTVLKFDTTPELIPGLIYTCPVGGGSLILTDPRTGQMQYINGYNRRFEVIAGTGGNPGYNGDRIVTVGCPAPADDSSWFLMGHYERQTDFLKLDMRGDSGLGQESSFQLFDLSSKYIEYAYGSSVIPDVDGFHYWFIVPVGYAIDSIKNISALIYSFLIGPDGPILQPIVSFLPLSFGAFIYASPEGSLLAADVRGNGDGIAIMHIDQLTGEVSLDHEIKTNFSIASAYTSHYAFSPNGKVLYCVAFDPSDSVSYILQYDLTRLNISDAPYIVAQSQGVSYGGSVANIFSGDMALTGNGRIYGGSSFTRPGQGGLPLGYAFSINSPDSVGAACHFVDTAFCTGYNGFGIWNGVPRVVHSTLQQISTVSLQSCNSSAYSFWRQDTGDFPKWTFEGGQPATASGPIVPAVQFDSAGAHEVFAVLSSGDTLMTLVPGGVSEGVAVPLYDQMYNLYQQRDDSTKAIVSPGGMVTIPIHVRLSYDSGGPDVTGDSLGHLMREYVLTFDTNILSLPKEPLTGWAPVIYTLGDEYEVTSARVTGNTLNIVVADTGGVESKSWWQNGMWMDTMDDLSITFQTTNSSNWHSTKVQLVRFSLDDGLGTRDDFCPEENNLLATVTNANAGVSQESASTNITLYPNPTTGVVTITGANGPVEVENVLGERVAGTGVWESGSGDVELDVSKLPAGTYFVRVETPGGIVVRRVVKE